MVCLLSIIQQFLLSCKCVCVWLRRGKLVSHSVFVVCLFGHGSNSYSCAAHFLLLLSPLLLPWWAGFGPSDDTCPRLSKVSASCISTSLTIHVLNSSGCEWLPQWPAFGPCSRRLPLALW